MSTSDGITGQTSITVATDKPMYYKGETINVFGKVIIPGSSIVGIFPVTYKVSVLGTELHSGKVNTKADGSFTLELSTIPNMWSLHRIYTIKVSSTTLTAETMVKFSAVQSNAVVDGESKTSTNSSRKKLDAAKSIPSDPIVYNLVMPELGLDFESLTFLGVVIAIISIIITPLTSRFYHNKNSHGKNTNDKNTSYKSRYNSSPT